MTKENKEIVAAILAGGEGRRLRPYTEIIPKPMLPIGPEEKPVLEYIISWLAKHKIKQIHILAGYRWKQIQNYFRDGSPWKVKITYTTDTPQYTGTGGALLNAYKKGYLKTKTTLIWYGDILAKLNPQDLLQKHKQWKAHATIAIATNYQIPVGLAQTDQENNIIKLEEKPTLPIKVTIGILALETKTLTQAQKTLGTNFDIMADLIPWMIKTKHTVKAYTYSGPWYDIGSMERYQKLPQQQLKEILQQNT